MSANEDPNAGVDDPDIDIGEGAPGEEYTYQQQAEGDASQNKGQSPAATATQRALEEQMEAAIKNIGIENFYNNRDGSGKDIHVKVGDKYVPIFGYMEWGTMNKGQRQAALASIKELQKGPGPDGKAAFNKKISQLRRKNKLILDDNTAKAAANLKNKKAEWNQLRKQEKKTLKDAIDRFQIPQDKLDDFLASFDRKGTVEEWINPAKCGSILESMYQQAGIPTSGPDSINVVKQCKDIAINMGIGSIQKTRDMLARQKGYLEGEKMKKEFALSEEITELMDSAEEIQKNLSGDAAAKFAKKLAIIDKKSTNKTKKRQMQLLLQSVEVTDATGIVAGLKAKGKIKLGALPVKRLKKLREEGSEVAYKRSMESLLSDIRSKGTSGSKKSQLITELQAVTDSAEISGFTPPAAVTAFLASHSDDVEAAVELPEAMEDEDSGGKLDVLKDVGSTIGSTVSDTAHSAGDVLGGNTGHNMSDIGNEMSGMASNIGKGGTDLDQFGKGGSPLESMSTEHQDDGPIHGSMKLKSVTLGKTQVGGGGLFKSSMTESGAGVGLGDWNPRAFDVAEGTETRGERFLRTQRQATEGEEGPLGGDIQPGTMSFDYSGLGGGGIGTRRLDLSAGQYTATSPFSLGVQKGRSDLDLGMGGMGTPQGIKDAAARMPDDETYHKQKGGDPLADTNRFNQEPLMGRGQNGSDIMETQPRTQLNLGLTDDQRPSTGVNLLGMGNVKAPRVGKLTAENTVPIKGPMRSGVINQATGRGFDTAHILGNTPKKKRKMNLFGGMPR